MTHGILNERAVTKQTQNLFLFEKYAIFVT